MALGFETAARNVQTLQKCAGATVSTVENSDSLETTATKFVIERCRKQREKPVTTLVKQAIAQINAVLRMHIVKLVARRGILLRRGGLPTVGGFL